MIPSDGSPEKADPPLAAAPSLEVERAVENPSILSTDVGSVCPIANKTDDGAQNHRNSPPSPALADLADDLIDVCSDMRALVANGVMYHNKRHDAAVLGMADRLEALAARLPALEASELDTKRLDWLNKQRQGRTAWHTVAPVIYQWHIELAGEDAQLRDAIDAGRSLGEDT